ncbi:hypothetical protein N3K66_007186 [Trichothecium roseum]|uniref:Uncharacterized protein n=1 Tax=Trichothecium roseum TaxID=47278 RepID=A0ACC0UUC6_9HYPO|nr:hypothetical protein N3K66_007186 [Trichothecium roseum]
MGGCIKMPLDFVKHMKRDPDRRGCLNLGKDGVIRTLSAGGASVLDARGLTPEEIRLLLDAMPFGSEVEASLAGVDGTKVSQEALFTVPPEVKERMAKRAAEREAESKEAEKEGGEKECEEKVPGQKEEENREEEEKKGETK